jgi:glycosyltransferase involved in cell wall biosynthesis
LTSERGEPIRVVWIAEGGLWGGIESHLCNLAEGLVERRGEVDARLILLEHGPLLEWARTGGPIPTELVPRNGGLGSVRALRSAVAALRPDVVHAHGLAPEVLTALACARTWPCVSTVHRLPGRRPWNAPDRGPLASCALWMSRRMAFRKLVAVTSDVRDRLVESGLGADRCEIIYNGVTLPDAQESSGGAAMRSQLELSPDTCVFGIVGRLDPVKGHARLFRAFARARRSSSDFGKRAILLVVGEGPLRTELERLAADLDLIANVRFLGFRDDVGSVLSALDVGVFASDHEGHPLAALEMMVRGVPLIAPAVGGLPEIIAADATGVLVPPASETHLAEAMIGLTHDVAKREVLGRAAKAAARERFTTDRMVDQLVSLWIRVSGPPG